MAIQTQTIANDIQEDVDSLVGRAKFVSKTDPKVLSILERIKQLENANSQAAHALRAYVLHMTGELEAALNELDQCEDKSPINRLILLANYSCCGQAQELFKEYGSPSKGEFSSLFGCGVASGALHQLAEFTRVAHKMRLTNLDKLPLEEIDMSGHLLTEFRISDHQIGTLMETAGAVLRKNGLLYLGNGPDVEAFNIPDELKEVHLTYRLPVSPSEAVGLYMEFVDRLEETNQVLPRGLHISFAGANA